MLNASVTDGRSFGRVKVDAAFVGNLTYFLNFGEEKIMWQCHILEIAVDGQEIQEPLSLIFEK